MSICATSIPLFSKRRSKVFESSIGAGLLYADISIGYVVPIELGPAKQYREGDVSEQVDPGVWMNSSPPVSLV